MSMIVSRWRRWRTRLLTSLVVAGCWPIGIARTDELPPTAPPATAADQANARALTLDECLGIALQQQPALAAHQASLAAADTSYQGLLKLHAPPLISRDLPIRRQQACLGVTIAEAG